MNRIAPLERAILRVALLEMLHPDLRAASADPIAARLLPPTGRRLFSQAFQRLPQSARALLWPT